MRKTSLIFLLLSLVASACTMHFYIGVKRNKLNSEFATNFLLSSDAIYRFGLNALNTNFTIISKDDENSGVITNGTKDLSIRDLRESIYELSAQLRLNPIIGDNLWTIVAVYPEYIIPVPFRDAYKDLYFRNGSSNNYLQHVLELDGVNAKLQLQNKLPCGLVSVYGPYIEFGTNEELFSIYYPVYINRNAHSMLVVDLKSHFLEDFVSKFNNDNLTYFKLKDNSKYKTGVIVERALSFQSKQKHFKFILESNCTYFIITTLLLTIALCCIYFLVIVIWRRYKQSEIDKLTGFYRKDKFNNKKISNYSMCVIDIDHFKLVNDTYGHSVGDIVITEVASRIRSSIREVDIPIRWGGEEFVVIFNGKIPFEKLNIKLNKFLTDVSSEKINGIDVTISIGAINSESELFLMDAFKFADRALYESKNSGRNKFTIATSF
ncbi:MAG: GGDEF domain-containing protein [Shewanella sp.]